MALLFRSKLKAVSGDRCAAVDLDAVDETDEEVDVVDDGNRVDLPIVEDMNTGTLSTSSLSLRYVTSIRFVCWCCCCTVVVLVLDRLRRTPLG